MADPRTDSKAGVGEAETRVECLGVLELAIRLTVGGRRRKEKKKAKDEVAAILIVAMVELLELFVRLVELLSVGGSKLWVCTSRCCTKETRDNGEGRPCFTSTLLLFS